MIRGGLLDTGPLVAFLNPRDRYHGWTEDLFADVEPPLHTCEAVISEACFLLRHLPEGPRAVNELMRRQLVIPSFRLADEIEAVARLMRRYASVPMALADGCLVRMAEIHNGSVVLTVDSDFTIYRIHGRRVIPTRMPPI